MKKVSLLLILIFSAITLSAQEESGISKEAGKNATFARNGFLDNWFIGAGVGTNIYFGDTDDAANFLSRPTFSGNVQVGKWFNPYLGARVKGSIGQVHTFSKKATVMNRFTMAHGEVDFLFDVTNYFGKYNENRFYSFIPYVGLGASYARKHSSLANATNKHHEKGLTLNGGLINRFRVTDKLDIDLELSAVVLKDEMDRRPGGKRAYDLLANGSVNFVYKLGGKTNFSEALLMNQGELDNLNGEINRLKAENDLLGKRPKDCPKCPEVVAPQVVEVVKASATKGEVFFRIGSSNIDNNQEASIFNIAQHLKDNSNAKVTVAGYADKKTGSASYNTRISEKRAKNVANTLINKYNINSSRVNVKWDGDKVQPYTTQNTWNRVVIMLSE